MSRNKKLLHACLVALCAVPVAATATNGMFMPGAGARSLGMGGAAIGYAQDAFVAASNPAGILDVGMRLDAGISIFNPERYAAVWDRGFPDNDGAGGQGFSGGGQSAKSLFFIPGMGITMPLTEKLSVGFAMAAAGGGNTTFHENFFTYGKTTSSPLGSSPLGVDLMQLLIPVTLAYKVTDTQGLGISLVPGVQRFSARGLEAFSHFNLPLDDTKFTNNGDDYAFGLGTRLGWRGKFMDDRLTLGASWASKVYMSRFEKYSSLFAEQGKLDIPENYGIGLSFKVTPNMNVALDVTKTIYTGVAAIGNRGPGLVSLSNDGTAGTDGIPTIYNGYDKATYACEDGPGTGFLGMDCGMGFGWKDQTVYKLGVDYKVNDKWTVRGGLNYGKTPIPQDQMSFSLLAPATTEKHVSAGATYAMDDTMSLSFMYMQALSHSQFSCGNNVIDCAYFKMLQRHFEVDFTMKYD